MAGAFTILTLRHHHGLDKQGADVRRVVIVLTTTCVLWQRKERSVAQPPASRPAVQAAAWELFESWVGISSVARVGANPNPKITGA